MEQKALEKNCRRISNSWKSLAVQSSTQKAAATEILQEAYSPMPKGHTEYNLVEPAEVEQKVL